MTPFLKELRQDLIRDEGLVLRPYFDSRGYVTMGVGHNLAANPLTAEQRKQGRILGFESAAFALSLLDEDLRMLERYLTEMHDWINDLPQHQQRALWNMAFQLGPENFSKFEPTWVHLRAGELDLVEQHLRNSLWYKQVPKRAERIIKLLKGET